MPLYDDIYNANKQHLNYMHIRGVKKTKKDQQSKIVSNVKMFLFRHLLSSFLPCLPPKNKHSFAYRHHHHHAISNITSQTKWNDDNHSGMRKWEEEAGGSTILILNILLSCALYIFRIYTPKAQPHTVSSKKHSFPHPQQPHHQHYFYFSSFFRYFFSFIKV